MKKQFFLTLLLIAIGSSILAKKLTILELRNCTSIKVGKKTLKKGDFFESWQTIHWNNGRQMVLVIDEKGHKSRLTHKGFLKHKVSTPEQYFIAEQSLGTRGYSSNSDNYTRHDYYLTPHKSDTLLFPVKQKIDSDMRIEAVWKDEKGYEIVTPLTMTKDGRYFIVSPKIWKSRKPQDIKLTIRETSNDGSWTDNIYQDIHIVLP